MFQNFEAHQQEDILLEGLSTLKEADKILKFEKKTQKLSF